MKVYARDTLLVRREHTVDHLGITDARGTFIVDHEVVALGVIGIAVNGDRRLGALVRRMRVIDLDIYAPLQPLLQDVLLVRVIMAATARDQQRPQRLGKRFLFFGQTKICSQQAENHQEAKYSFHDECVGEK